MRHFTELFLSTLRQMAVSFAMPTTQRFVHAPIITYTNQHICIFSPIQDWGPEVKGHLIQFVSLMPSKLLGTKSAQDVCWMDDSLSQMDDFHISFVSHSLRLYPSPHHDQFSHQMWWLFHFSNRVDSYSFLSHLHSFFSFRLIFSKSSQDIDTFTSQYYLKLQSKPNFFSILSNLFPLKLAFPPELTISTNVTTMFSVMPWTYDLILSYEFSVLGLLQGPILLPSISTFTTIILTRAFASHHLEHYIYVC